MLLVMVGFKEFEREWKGKEGTIADALKKLLGREKPLRYRLAMAHYKINTMIKRLEVYLERLKSRDQALFERVVDALMSKDNTRAVMYANEIAELRKIAKHMIIAANKADLEESKYNIEKMKKELKEYVIVPVSAEAELALRKAAKANYVKYLPGDKDFKIHDPSKLTKRQKKALEYIKNRVFKVWGSTGVQDVINKAFLDVLKMIVVFPVEDENKLTDHEGNVLPDAFLVPSTTKPRDLAYMIHTDLGKGFIAALDVRTKMRIPSDEPLRHRTIVKIYTRK